MKTEAFEIQILVGPRFVLRSDGAGSGREFSSVKDALDFISHQPGGQDAEKRVVDSLRKRVMKVVW
jgi:hypothetical protein